MQEWEATQVRTGLVPYRNTLWWTASYVAGDIIRVGQKPQYREAAATGFQE